MEKDYIYQGLELNDVHFDTLREICNIGMGHAATAFNQMIGKPVMFSIPEISMVSPAQVPDFIGGIEQVVVGIYLKIWGDIQGNIILVFPRKSARDLCSLLTGGAPGDEFVLSEIQASALREIGNILASSYLSALERLLGKTLIPSVPGVAFDMAGTIVDYIRGQLGEEADYTLVVKAAFTGGGESIHGHFYLLPDPASLKIILEAAKVLAVEEASR